MHERSVMQNLFKVTKATKPELGGMIPAGGLVSVYGADESTYLVYDMTNRREVLVNRMKFDNHTVRIN